MRVHARSKALWLVAFFACAILAISALFVRMYFYEPNQLEITRLQIPVKQWAGTQKRATLCAVSDVHWRPEDEARAQKIVSAMLDQKPDAFLLLGDYAFGHSREQSMTIEKIIEKFAPLVATGTPCFAVFGNHDAYVGREAFANAFQKAGIHVFYEAGTELLQLSGGREIIVGGTLDAHSYLEIFDESCVPKNPSPRTQPFVLLSHSPDVVAWLNETVDITLCGHTHGGQICLPDGKPLFTSTRTKIGGNYSRGLSTVPAGGKIFTTRGTGTSILPFRLFCLPEIVVIELVAAK